MAVIQLAPVGKKPSRQEWFLAPTGVYYSLDFPSKGVALELVEAGVRRVVVPVGTLDAAGRQVLLDAGVEIVWREAA